MTPGEAENAAQELRLAEQALKSSRLLLKASALEDTASRLYYAAFHAARAALAIKGLSAKTHSGLLTLYSGTFGAEPILRRLFEARSQADYDIKNFKLDSAQLSEMMEETESFLRKVRQFVNTSVAKGADQDNPDPDT